MQHKDRALDLSKYHYSFQQTARFPELKKFIDLNQGIIHIQTEVLLILPSLFETFSYIATSGLSSPA
jgi:hypothetical protein